MRVRFLSGAQPEQLPGFPAELEPESFSLDRFFTLSGPGLAEVRRRPGDENRPGPAGVETTTERPVAIAGRAAGLPRRLKRLVRRRSFPDIVSRRCDLAGAVRRRVGRRRRGNGRFPYTGTTQRSDRDHR
jgi:hypothetical protein